MSLLGEAFENTISLSDSLVVPFKEVEPVTPIIDEPMYIDSTTQSAISASNINKRVNNLRVTQENPTVQLPSPSISVTSESTKNIFSAIIHGYEPLQQQSEEYRWQYQWYEAKMEWSSGRMVQDELGRSGNGAWNLYELPNMEEIASGLMIDGPFYPPQLSPLPIGALSSGDIIKVGVIMYEMIDESENLRYVFSVPNSHDGICTE